MTAPFDDSEHARITQTTPDYSSIPWNNDFSKIPKYFFFVSRDLFFLDFIEKFSHELHQKSGFLPAFSYLEF